MTSRPLLVELLGVSRSESALQAVLRSERAKNAAAMRQAQAIAARLPRIVIEREAVNAYWVTCTGLEGDTDPLDGDHFATDGREVLEMVRTYAAALEGDA